MMDCSQIFLFQKKSGYINHRLIGLISQLFCGFLPLKYRKSHGQPRRPGVVAKCLHGLQGLGMLLGTGAISWRPRWASCVCFFGDSTITDSHNPISSIAMLCYVITVITSDYSDLLLIVKIVT